MQDSSKLSRTPPPAKVEGGGTFSILQGSVAADDSACLRTLEPSTRIVAGNAGDHPLVLQLLVQTHQAPLAEDFQSRLDEPSYEPSDRLLVKRENKLVGHVQVSKQFGWFQQQRCPVARLHDFTSLPEYQTANIDQPLLEVAEELAIREGSIVGVVRTARPEWFEQYGWSCCRGQGHTRANTRAILSHFDSQRANRRCRESAVEIRSWRHFQLDSLEQIYRQISPSMWGPLHRSLEAWQWLAGRKAQDQILIAVIKPRRKSKGSSHESKVIGYAVVRDSCIVEMLTLPGFENASAMLVVRACRDAIDRDHHFVSLHTPAADPMHELLVTAGGSWIGDGTALDGKWMLKLLAPDRWIERLYPLLHERAREAGIPRPLEIDFAVGKSFHRLSLTRRSSRLERLLNLPEPHVHCDYHTFQNLLTSNLRFPNALLHGQLRVAHESLARTLAALFPPKLFWQSPFPLLRL